MFRRGFIFLVVIRGLEDVSWVRRVGGSGGVVVLGVLLLREG